MNKNLGFTLAEVLITLGIIGIVAAMTMPSLIAKYQKRQTVVQFKKAYATISQAIKLSEAENGSAEYWDYHTMPEDFYNKYLKKYLKSVEEIKHSEIKKRVTYKYLNGQLALSGQQGLIGNPETFTVKLSDGSFFMVDRFYNTTAAHGVAVDLNGYAGPNQIGKDVFYLVINSKGLVGTGNPEVNDSDMTACSRNQTGYGCGAKIIQDGWEIKDDYPW